MTAVSPTNHAIPRRSQEGPRPLSFPQERLYLLDRIIPGLAAYNVPTLVRVGATLDEALLQQALETIVARHEILRTTIRLIEGVPMQEVSAPRQVDMTIADLRSNPGPGREAEARRFLGELARQPFDLSHDLLLRVGLVHLSAEQDLLLIVLHHAASDHASSTLLFAELDAVYGALRSGSAPAMPELPIQYADYAEWQREQLSGSLLDDSLEYWTKQLAGAPDRLELPTDHPRPSAQSYRGALREFTIEAALAGRLRESARSHGVSMFMVLLAGFEALLHRYTGAEDLVVGVPASGRHHEEIARLLGFFSNTLALRTDLSGDPSFSEVLARVKVATLEAQVYQELPFEKLVEVLNPERAQSHSPIFQVLLGYDVAPSEPPKLAGQRLEFMPVPDWEFARFDLSIVLREVPDGSLHAQLEYSTDLFEPLTVERLIGHFVTLLAAVTSGPGQRLSELPILTADERAVMLDDWNATSELYDCRCLHELFSDVAERLPDAIAVVSGTQKISFGELERRSNQLARELVAAGAGRGALVGICHDRSVDLVIALLAVLKSGAAYVPIDPTYPPQRQAFMVADAEARILITQERYVGVVDARGGVVLCLDRDRHRIDAQRDEPLEIKSDPEQLAYVIYTSGSTGQPKGVEVTHRSVANLISYMRQAPGLSEQDVLANLTTPAFDLSVPDWYLPLTTGARLVIIPREVTLDGVELADWLARSGATFVQATPTTWQLLVDAGWPGSSGLKIVCGGEALPPALADELLSRGASLWHMYGPTETTVWSSVLELESSETPVPIGGPIANTRFYVLDSGRQPVPVGVPGELYIGGDGLALGYHERRQLTEEKFLCDPFASRPEERLYRTGDLVRWRHDGKLEFHGRIDQQVKLRGYRIELGEIEAALAGRPDVSAAVAAVSELGPGDHRLIAYVVPGAGRTPDVDELRRVLKTTLPPFMVPSTFVVLETLPVTANGKLDRGALPAPDGARPQLRPSFASAETPMQQKLASLWRDVLGVERVGIDDDFFDLGGHSLLAVKMLGRAQEAFGLEIYLGTLFDQPTIRELAETLTVDLLDGTAEGELESLLTEVEAAEQ
jgi:amino acid adenylation domain-containing protein